jgi:rod shape-determining protein MreC
MQPSRDDFVIAIRSAFLKKGNKQRFSLFFLLFLSVVLISFAKFNFKAISYIKSGINEIVYRSSFIVSIPENLLSNSYEKINNHLKLYKDYEQIKNELEIKKSKKYDLEFLIAENLRLKKTLEVSSLSGDQIVAKVIIDKQSPFLQSVIINKGSKNKIKKGMAVLNDSYLIGKIVEVNFLTSRVLLLSDLNSKIPVTIEPGAIQSIVSGTGLVEGIVQYTNKNLVISEGSTVFTSGAANLFKPGIPIGKIFLNKEKKMVEFFTDFSQLRFVNVVSYYKDEN